MKEVLSIKEVSRIANVSCQAIYQQLDKKLKPYLVIVDNKKKLKKSVLEEVYGIKENQQTEQRIEQETDKILIKQNQQLIDMLQKELEEKNKQIADLQRLLNQQQQLSLVDKGIYPQGEADQEEPKAEELKEEPEKKKSWFSKFFSLV